MRKNKRKHRLWGLVLTFGLILGLLPSGVLAESDEGHTHTDTCYCKGGELICGEEESAGHIHDDSCYETVTTEDGETEQTLICGETESEGHSHTADCYCEGGELVCGQDAIDGEMGIDEDIDAGFTISEEEEAAGTRSHAAETETEVQAETENQVDVYISDGTKWVKAGSLTTSKKTGGRYFVYADELDSILGKYGFNSAAFQGENWFPNTDYKTGNTSASKIWGDSAPTKEGTRYKIWLTRHDNTLTDLFYTPKKTDYPSDSGVDRNDAELLSANKVEEVNYYTLRITNPNNLSLSDAEQAVLGSQQWAKNQSYTITLPIDSTLTWVLYDTNGKEAAVTPSVNEDGTKATYTITADQSYELRASACEDVHCYVQVNGEWIKKDSLFATKEIENRFYISAEALEEVYGEYGFAADSYNGERVFPHTTTWDKTGKIWFDTASQKIDGEWWIPLSAYQRKGPDINLYYVPGNKDDSIITSETPENLETTQNSFYSIKVTNPSKLPLAEGVAVPADCYKQGNIAFTVTLPKITTEKGEWEVLTSGNTVAEKTATENQNSDTVIYTITNLSGAVTFVASEAGAIPTQVIYQAKAKISDFGKISNFPAPTEIVKNAENTESTVALTEDGSYKVAEPNSYIVQALSPNGDINKTRTLTYSFKGWEVENSNGVILQPNQTLTRAELLSYSDNGQVTLKAIWKGVEDNGWIPSANFYVSLNCEIKDNKGDGVRKDNPAESFTSSLFATRMLGTENIPADELDTAARDGYALCISEDSSNAAAIDQEIHEMKTTAIPMPTGRKTPLKMENFPTDEQVLAKIQAAVANGEKTVKVDGQEVSADKLTTDHFKVRWYVVKYLNADGWHVDGVLVAKEAHFRVTLKFDGDSDAIKKVEQENDFYITVTHENNDSGTATQSGISTQETDLDYKHLLRDKNMSPKVQDDEENEGIEVGYTEYKDGVYMWELTARPGRQYTIQQKNQTVNGYTCTASYEVVQPKDTDTEAEVLANDYADVANKGILITAHSYANDRKDLYQKIELFNSYTASAEIPIQPVDPGKDKPVVITPPSEPDNPNPDNPDKPSEPDTPSKPSHSHKSDKTDNQPSEPDTKPDTPSEPDNQPSEPDTKPDTPNEPDNQPSEPDTQPNGNQTITQPDAAGNTADVSNQDTVASVDTVPQTGDSMNPVLWASLLGISLAGLGVAFVLMKKKQNR